MKNYPLVSGQVKVSEQLLVSYISSFSEHKFLYKGTSGDSFQTQHIFDDGLHIVFDWKVTDPRRFGKGVTPAAISNAYKMGRIEVDSFDIVGYSHSHYLKDITDNIRNKFDLVIRSCKDFSYDNLEYNVTTPTNIPDSLFDELIHSIDCHLRFKEYLKEKGKILGE